MESVGQVRPRKFFTLRSLTAYPAESKYLERNQHQHANLIKSNKVNENNLYISKENNDTFSAIFTNQERGFNYKHLLKIYSLVYQ